MGKRKWLIAQVIEAPQEGSRNELLGIGTTRNIIIGEFHESERNAWYLTRALDALIRERLRDTGKRSASGGKIYTLRLGKLEFKEVYNVCVFGWLNRSGKINEEGKFVAEGVLPMKLERCGEVLYKD